MGWFPPTGSGVGLLTKFMIIMIEINLVLDLGGLLNGDKLGSVTS
jgi:hypothetical protein